MASRRGQDELLRAAGRAAPGHRRRDQRAYRKKALELHPDRNYGNVEWATKLFAEVQAAYEVLSDPQERAWYDSHESAILRGDDAGSEEQHFEGNIKMTTADDIARMVRKFNSGVEFSDSPSGFFGFLRETFEQLAKEEQAAASWEGLDVPDYPSFGHRDDEYDDVAKPFYSVWMSFATRKTFAWKDKYRLSEAPDRRYRRLMEKENMKAREEGIREFNEAVRSLVAFVRKRDPRYIPNTQTEAERQKVLRDAAAAQAARARAANEAKLQGPYQSGRRRYNVTRTKEKSKSQTSKRTTTNVWLVGRHSRVRTNGTHTRRARNIKKPYRRFGKRCRRRT
ncbi:hypothetical protein H2203_002716 [Taxawa tesnikishii (nom. ined.)]|nr:hypothetical protein H2203_002716 [Dothideales sp. JES 119]